MGNAVNTDTSSYRGKRYEPSQYQVDLAYDEVVRAYRRIMDSWIGVDKELLLQMLLTKLKEEHPELIVQGLLLSPSTAAAVDDDDDDQPAQRGVVIANNKKKKKRRKIECGPIIMHGLRITREVVARIVPYCDNRLSINNFSSTCRGAYQAIHDRKLVQSIPWPISHCPWPKPIWHFVASRDMSLFAVIRKCRYLEPNSPSKTDMRHMEIWHQRNGLIGEVEWHHWDFGNYLRPVFSPDNQLLLAPLVVYDVDKDAHYAKGVQAVQFPSDAQPDGPIVVSKHYFNGNIGRTVEFLNNDTVAVAMRDFSGIQLWEIRRENGSIRFSLSRHILQDELPYPPGRIKSFVWGNKTLLVIQLGAGSIPILFHVLTSNESFLKSLHFSIADFAFLPSGKLMVTSSSEEKIYIYDCKINTIEEIGEPIVLCFKSMRHARIISFSIDGTKVILLTESTFEYGYGMGSPHYHLIDLQKGEILSEKILDENEWDEKAWDSFVN